MPTLDEPNSDPDGQQLMASLRERLKRGQQPVAPTRTPDEQYRPAMAAVQGLLTKRQGLNASQSEIQKLLAIARVLQALATEVR